MSRVVMQRSIIHFDLRKTTFSKYQNTAFAKSSDNKKTIARKTVPFKMSRAKEIKEKQELQAKLASAFSSKTATVLSWLSTDSVNGANKISKDTALLSDARKDFFNLPVVATGAGLSFEDEQFTAKKNETNHEDIATVGEFIKSNKKISTLAKKKMQNSNPRDNLNSTVYRIRKDDSKATIALKNKLRNTKRNDLRNQMQNNPSGKAFQNGRTNGGNIDPSRQRPAEESEDDGEEHEQIIQKTTKKSGAFPLQFGKKKK